MPLGRGEFAYFSLDPPEAGGGGGDTIQLELQVRIGAVQLFCATAGLPTRGRYAAAWPTVHGHGAGSTHLVPAGGAGGGGSLQLELAALSDCNVTAAEAADNPYFFADKLGSMESHFAAGLRSHMLRGGSGSGRRRRRRAWG